MEIIKRRQAAPVDFFLLAAAIVAAAYLLGGSLVKMKRTDDAITVTGSAKRGIRSDLIIWRGSVSSQQATMQSAYQEVKKFSDRVRVYLKENGVPAAEIKFPALNTEQILEYSQSGQPTGRTLGYRLTQSFEVRSERVDSVAALAVRAGDLVSEGVPLMSFPPEYLFTKLSELRIAMLGEATADAKARAAKIAEASGSKIGSVRSARMGVFQITPRNSTEVSDYGFYDTSSLDKDITSVVSVSFALK